MPPQGVLLAFQRHPAVGGKAIPGIPGKLYPWFKAFQEAVQEADSASNHEGWRARASGPEASPPDRVKRASASLISTALESTIHSNGSKTNGSAWFPILIPGCGFEQDTDGSRHE